MANPVKYTDLVEAEALAKIANDARVAIEMLNGLIVKQKEAAANNNKASGGTKSEEDQIKVMQEKIKVIETSDATYKKYIDTKAALIKAQRIEKDAIKASIGVTENSTQALRRMQQELAKLPAGTKEFNDLAKKAGALKDKINDAKDAVKAFSSESKLTNARTLFGQIGSDLANMNFSDAADKARTLANVVRSMTFAEAAKGVKDFGSTLLSLGKAMLLNPFTLIAGAVVGLGVVLWNLKDRVKIISDAFNFFGNIIAGSIQAMKDFADWTKLTAFAAEEKAVRIRKAAEVEQEAIKRQYSLEIEIAKIKGKETLFLERAQLLERRKYLKRKIEQEILSNEEMNELADIEDALILNKEKQRQLLLNKIKQSGINQEKTNQEKSNKTTEEGNKKTFELNTDFITNQENFYLALQKIQEENNKSKLDAQQKKIDFEFKKTLDEQNLDKEMYDLAIKWQEEEDKKDEERDKKQIERIEKQSDQITKGISEGLQKRSELQQQADQKDIDMHTRMLEVQAKLAAEGKDNVLGETEAKTAKAEEKKLQDAKKSAKQQETIALIDTFTKTLQAGLKSGDPFLKAFGQALASEGLVSSAFSKLFSGFYEGTESVKSTDGFNIGTSKDSQVVRVHTGERILGVQDSAEIPEGMTNRDVVAASQMYMNPEMKSTFFPAVNESVLQQQNNYDTKIYEMTSEFKAMRKAFESRPVEQNHLGRLGEWTNIIQNENVKTIIHHKNSNKRPSLRLNG